jgi:hypothetical protein
LLGPIDYIAVGFIGNNFKGDILKELQKSIDSKIIRLVDLTFIIKDSTGDVAIAEIEDQHEDIKQVAEMIGFDDETPLMTENDLKKLGASMENNTSAGVLVIEHLWAKNLKKAILDADGFLLAEGRIHPDAVSEAVKELKTVEVK